MRSTQYLISAIACVSCGVVSAAETASQPSVDAGVAITAATIATVSTSAPIAADVAPETPRACPDGMILVEGDFCPDVEQKCLEWMDPPGRYQFFRCKRYEKLGDAACKSKARKHERFCIDEKERTEPDSDVPLNHQSWTSAKKLCEENGARLCLTREWVFACEGEEMRPYPYGWDRDSSICNADIDHGLGHVGRLVDHRTPASAHPQCTSAFGAHDMAGNVDEWTTIEGAPVGSREVMHGSWWMPGRNACRSYQGGHGAFYQGTESGARCCADPKEP